MRVRPTRTAVRAGQQHALAVLAVGALVLTACGPDTSTTARSEGLTASSGAPTGVRPSLDDAFGTPASSTPGADAPVAPAGPDRPGSVDDGRTSAASSSGTTGSGPTGSGPTGSGTSGSGTTSPPASTGTSTGSTSTALPTGSTGTTAPGSPGSADLSGPLAGLQCTAEVATAEGSALSVHASRGATVGLRERQARLAFAPVLLARGGEAGDVASALASYVALDAQGRLHYVEVAITRDGTGQAPAATVSVDRVLAQGYDGARALGASVAFHAGGDPEVFVVDAQGRLLRHTLSAGARQLTLSGPTVLATGLGGVTAMSVETFDVDGDLAQERDAATRVLLVDGDQVRQTIVRRDGVADPLLTVLGPGPELAGATALTRASCLRPGGSMSDTGALVVFGADGVGRLYGGTYTPAVAAPRLLPSGALASAVPGLLAG